MRQDRLRPIRWIEKHVLDAALDPDATTFCHDYLTIYWAIRMRPGLNRRSLSRAFDRLVARHEPLRLRFVEAGGQWMAEVLPKHPVGLIVEELGPASEAEQQEIVTERARRPLTALSDALFEMRQLRFGDSGDILMIRANHAIFDGYSFAQLSDELFRLILRLPLGPSPLSYGDYVAYQDGRARDRDAEKKHFWSRMLVPPPPELKIGRSEKALGAMTPAVMGKPLCHPDVLGKPDSDRVEAHCGATGVSAYAVLHAAFCETLCDLAGTDAVLVNGIYGRNDTRLASYIGASIEIAPLRYVRQPGSFHNAVRQVSEKVAAIADHLPTRHLDPMGDIMQQIRDAGVTSDRFWVLAPTPTGRMRSSVFGGMFDGIAHGALKLGHMTLENVPIPPLAQTDAELELTLSQQDGQHHATLYADAAGFDAKTLAAIAAGIRRHLSRT